MITPVFELSQDDDFLYIQIEALLAKISDTEIFVDDDELCFYSTPYYLRLHLPGSIVEDGNESCTYEEGKFSLKFSKKVNGEFFSGLEMITSLLTPKGNKTAKLPLIEVLSSKDAEEDGSNNGNTEASPNKEEFSWYVKQDSLKSGQNEKINMHYGYGFANQRSSVFTNLQKEGKEEDKKTDEFASVIDIKDPDNISTKMRLKKKFQIEEGKFNPDHFIADFVDEDKQICTICDYIPPWVKVWQESLEKGYSFQSVIELTSDEKYKLSILPKKEHLIDDSTILKTVYLGLVDILFAYCYNDRANEGEKNLESGWTIAKLSSVLSCLVAFVDLKDVVVSCFRRSLCYPLYRSWKLNMIVLSDLTILLRAGRLQILKCLLEIKGILQEYELNHILNDLYIMDYCVWIQTADENLLSSLADELSKIVIKTVDCDLDLPDWEDIAIGELEESDTVRIVSSMSQLKIKKLILSRQRFEEIDEDGNSSSFIVDSDDYSDSDDSSSSSEEEESDSSEEEEKEKEDSNCIRLEEEEKEKEDSNCIRLEEEEKEKEDSNCIRLEEEEEKEKEDSNCIRLEEKEKIVGEEEKCVLKKKEDELGDKVVEIKKLKEK